MGLFDEIGKEIGKFAKTAADKTSNMVEITRLGSKISAQNDNIARLKAKIGEFYWEKFAAGEPCDPALVDTFSEIESAIAQIASFEAEIRAIKESEAQTVRTTASPVGGAKCGSCGASNEEGARFCRECGSAILQQAAESGRLLCPTCGAQLAAEAKFCGECGGKV